MQVHLSTVERPNTSISSKSPGWTFPTIHNSSSVIVDNVTVTDQLSFLKLIVDGNIADCCLADAKFVHVKLTLDYTILLHQPVPAGSI